MKPNTLFPNHTYVMRNKGNYKSGDSFLLFIREIPISVHNISRPKYCFIPAVTITLVEILAFVSARVDFCFVKPVPCQKILWF